MARIEASRDSNDQHFYLSPNSQRVVMYGELIFLAVSMASRPSLDSLDMMSA
jgi:hypothetical protein